MVQGQHAARTTGGISHSIEDRPVLKRKLLQRTNWKRQNTVKRSFGNVVRIRREMESVLSLLTASFDKGASTSTLNSSRIAVKIALPCGDGS